jgi:glycosyltransferase involved in cell wall biosynthesis
MKPKVSATIICKNEAHNIDDCLRSVAWCDEIVVVDSGSTDDTVARAGKYTPKVIFHEWPGYIEQKNYALDQATGDWVISLDADERCTPELQAALGTQLESADPALAGFEVKRHTRYLGRWIDHGGWYPDWKLRVVRRGKARWGGVNPHDKLLPDGPVKRIDADLLHYTYQNFAHHMRIMNHFSDVICAEYLKEGRKPSVFQAVFHPPWKFFETYILKLGILDGFPGFVVCSGMAFTVFARYVKLWESGQREK